MSEGRLFGIMLRRTCTSLPYSGGNQFAVRASGLHFSFLSLVFARLS
jgi:hypothetical protein